MKVREAIEKLKKLPDKELDILLDCPHCGEAQQLEEFAEVVVMRGKEKLPDPRI